MAKILSNEEIGKKIRTFRLLAGLTQERLAEELEITFQQVQKYERGTTKVNLVKLQQIANALQLPVSAFFEDSAPDFEISDVEYKLLRAFREIKEPALKASILEILNGLLHVK